ncbi:uncharacterized protein LOC125003566 [Mugil cephalus]|uniref:uncharacterized protein LOC125003566 n=1 Tax=Mugil cephalus TaxID=48193 RepID=UPI001FB5717E|nr:uncharacterized protein LOC125003566 [Mugil cephalus]
MHMLCVLCRSRGLGRERENEIIQCSEWMCHLRFLLHSNYKCENVTSREIRRVVETEAANTFTEEQQSGVAHYMAHSTSVAKQHYRMRTLHKTVVTSNLLQSLRGSSPEDSTDGRAGQSQKRGREEETDSEEKETENMTAFLSKFPVTLNGQPPCKRIRVSAGFSEGRVLYDRWRVMQRGMREDHLLSVFVRRAPTVQTVARRIEKEGWSGNTPQAQLVVSKWRPPTQTQVESDPRIIKKVTTQKWSGLTIKDFGEPKGKGVVATKRFSKGSVICDYHGRVITKAEGKRMMQSMDNEMGYLFFFQELCVDAQTFPCECHPHTETVGRLMKHSKKRFNAKPRRCKLKLPQGETDTILLLASKDIEVGEEIRFDYGVCRQSFSGEGLDLEWLDS